MKMEIRTYYQNTLNSIAHLDKECSVLPHEVSEIDIKAYIEYFETLGYKRHENSKTFWYEGIVDARHSTEYIFYK